MKKKTNLQSVSAGDDVKAPRERRHGPPKEKVQVTIRLDKQLMDEAYAQMKEDNTRITDIIERGIYLALRERNHDMPVFTKQIRFVLANATREQQVLLRGLAIAMVEPELEISISQEASKIFEMVKWFLESRNKQPHAATCLEYYSRYGKSAEEIAKLGRL